MRDLLTFLVVMALVVVTLVVFMDWLQSVLQ